MSEREKPEVNEPEADDSREPLLTPDHVTDADTEFKQEALAEEAAHGLDQLDGPEIEAVMHREGEEEQAAEKREQTEDAEEQDEQLDDLFDPPGYYEGDGDSPVGPEDEDVGIRDEEVEGPRRQVGEAAHNPPIGQAPKKGKEEEA